MKILFDHQIFASQKYGGVSKYFAELLYNLPEGSWDLPSFLSNNEYVYELGLIRKRPFLPRYEFRGKGRMMAELGKPHSIMKIKAGKYDVFHQTNYDDYCIKYLANKPMVTTYHDVNFLTEQNYNKRMDRLQHTSLKRADKIVAISENTKKDIQNFFDVDEKRIKVIYHGVDRFTIPSSLEDRVFPYPYILFVGNRHLFKNFATFIEAFGNIAPKYKEIHVVCTKSDFTVNEKEKFHQLGITDKMHVIKADEMTLARLYRDAVFFIFPSKYEGFGMPILEAFSRQCPVALSNTSCFPEIAMDAGAYFDPNDVDSIAETMIHLLDDSDYRELLKNRGNDRVACFSWEKCAKEHYDLYSSLV